LENLTPDTLAALWGLGIGAVIGAAAFWSNFCALGAVADILFARDWRRMRAWMMAAGVAMLGTQTLDSAEIIHIDRVLTPYLLWLPTALGGAIFGFGMSLAGGCVNRALVRVGAGSLKSLMAVLIVGATSAVTLSSFLAPLNNGLSRVGRIDLFVAPDALHRLFGALPWFDAEVVRWFFTALIAGGLIVFCLKDAWFRGSRDHLWAGVIIGLAIPAAWFATDDTPHQTAINFVGPTGDLVAALFTSREVSVFAIAAVVGVPLGAFVYAALTRNLALETFIDRDDVRRNIVGAILMGFGGSIALGCTFGQGLSGLSTLSVSAMIATGGILFGCLWGIRYFEAGGLWPGLKLCFQRGV
jgi:uncharacterized membrane protein YedE/YeeE